VDGRTDTVDVATAAARLGLSTDGVYKRIKRGRLRVQRVDGRTFVVLDSPSTTVDTAHTTDRPTDGRTDGLDGPVRPSVDTDEQARFPELENPTVPLVDQLQSDVTFLRDELRAQREQHAAEVERLHERLREAHVLLAQRPALPAPSMSQLDNLSDVPPRPWWARWRWWRR
jgi:hypothetical protein